MNDPEIVPARAGETLWFLDTLMEVKAGMSVPAQHDVMLVGPPPPVA